MVVSGLAVLLHDAGAGGDNTRVLDGNVKTKEIVAHHLPSKKATRQDDDNNQVVLPSTEPLGGAGKIEPWLYCSQEQLGKGFWSDPDRNNATPPYLPTDETWFRQGCYGGGSGDLNGYYKSSWMLSSETCRFEQWKEETFCDLAVNKTFAFIGDSITWQQFSSLKYFLRFTPDQKTKQGARVWVCSNRTQLVWARNNYLDADGVEKTLKTHAPVHVVVANRGIWYKTDEEFLPALKKTLVVLKAWQNQETSDTATVGDSSSRLLVWRTTAPGIPSCSNEYAPNNDMASVLETRVNNQTSTWYAANEKRSMFGWWDIQRQNKVVMSLIQDYLQDKFEIIDAFAMYTRRPDLRMSQKDGKEKDCLHQCLPGVPDESNRVLQHLLQRKRDKHQRKKKKKLVR